LYHHPYHWYHCYALANDDDQRARWQQQQRARFPSKASAPLDLLFGGAAHAERADVLRVFYDFYEWRCMLWELSGVAARCFTHDACEERLWRELELAHSDIKPESALLLQMTIAGGKPTEGRYVDRQCLSQLIFALEPTRDGCALIYALAQIEIHCTTHAFSASSPEALYSGTAALFQPRDTASSSSSLQPEPTAAPSSLSA
jgi:hypothetical protein